jgi:hypothetical protein
VVFSGYSVANLKYAPPQRILPKPYSVKFAPYRFKGRKSKVKNSSNPCITDIFYRGKDYIKIIAVSKIAE